MKRLEEMARELCSLDLQRVGYSGADLSARVDRYWPVLAAEIYREGHAISGDWPFTEEEIRALHGEYSKLTGETAG